MTTSMREERALVERAKTEQAAFGQLFDSYYAVILNYILRRTTDLAVSQDIASIVFIKAWQGLPKYKWQNTPFSAWLYKIANNEITSYYRKRSNFAASIEEMFEQSGFEPIADYDIVQDLQVYEEELERHRDFKLVQATLTTLPLKYQEIVALRYFEKKSLKEIAAITGKKLNTVKSLLARGTDKLVKQFNAEKRKMQPAARKSVI